MSSINYLTILVGLCASFISSTSAEKPWESDYRLSKDVVPELYSLLLHPNLKEGTFSGTVDILLKITSSRDYIALHEKKLKIKTSILTSEKSDTNLVKNAFAYPKNEFWIVELNEPVSAGVYNLKLDFEGSLTDGINGFYRSTYKDESGQNRSIATTQFEPTYARQTLPCFDEPSFKAKYNVSIVRPSEGGFIALSNMNQLSEIADSPSQGLTTVTFATSVPMSSYLACFIVCDFEKLPPVKSKHGFDVTVYARSSQINKMQYTLQNAAAVVEYFIDYFSIDYPLPKLDLIAIPDFESGAMENWGLITFRETSVMYDTDFSTCLNHFAVQMVTAHEIAHMWFGNLVTMKWWDDLWLNEGFASFMEIKGSSHVRPDWDLDTLFIWYFLTDAMGLDSTLSSHPIIKHVSHPDQIAEIFDGVSYSKGASVLRMMEGFLGEENFRKGIVSYLKTFAFKNAETKDLWNHLKKFSGGVNIDRVMDTWTCQMGLPVLLVTKDGNTITVSQQRFTTDKNAKYDASVSPYKYKWDVPVTCITSDNKKSTLKWLLLEDSSVQIDVGNAEWYKLNWHFKGYYRVSYPAEHWATLTKVLVEDIKALDPADRVNLINDAFALAGSGYLDYGIALSLTNFLKKEDHFIVWTIASENLLNIDTALRDTDIHHDYREYLKKIITPLLQDSLWDFSDEKSILQRAFQYQLLYLACKVKIPECVNKAKQIFLDFLENNGPKPPVDVQTVVYSQGVAETGEEQWNKMWERYLEETDTQEKARLRNALTATKDEATVKRMIEYAKNEHYIRSQDYFSVISWLAYNPKANPVVWNWLRANWKYLVERFTLSNTSFGTLLPAVVGTYSSEDKLKEVKQFLAEHPEEGAGAASRKSAVENIELNILWLKNHLPTFKEWLKNN